MDHDLETSELPGRIGSDQIYYTEMGKARIFFYMSAEKDALSRNFIQSLNNNNLMISSDVTSPPCPVSEISLVVTKSDLANFELQGQITYDEKGRPLYPDPLGQEVLNEYARNVIKIAEKSLGIEIKGLSRDLSLNANHDALKIHQDRFSKQYAYLSQLPLPIPRYTLFQDLTLIDWSMAKGTISATMLQDDKSGDRFMMALFPGEAFGAIYSEPMVYHGPNVKPEYPGPITFPFHTAVAPIEYLGCCNVGSWKGKRISTSTRGVVLETEMEKAREKATYLPINRPAVRKDQNGHLIREYSNGITLKEITNELPKVSKGFLHRLPDKESISIYQSSIEDHVESEGALRTNFEIKGKLKQVFHLVKKNGGFSKFENIFPDLSLNSEVFLVNQSVLPETYKFYTVSEDCTKRKLPWIQLYQFPLQTIMKLQAETFLNMSLTPVEEILFRNEFHDGVQDADDPEASRLTGKLTSAIDVYIFSKE